MLLFIYYFHMNFLSMICNFCFLFAVFDQSVRLKMCNKLFKHFAFNLILSQKVSVFFTQYPSSISKPLYSVQ